MPVKIARPDLARRIEMHRLFWERGPQPWPIAAFRIESGQFTSRYFRAADSLLERGKTVTPDMLVVEDFLPDYERMFRQAEELGQDAFWTAEPFPGVPWIEAMLGCGVRGGGDSIVSVPWMSSLDDLDKLVLRPDDPWLLKYLEFTEKLAAAGRGRFPVGQPILRGPSDIAGAVLGATEMVMAFMDEPEKMRELTLRAGMALAQLLEAQAKLIPPFHGGSVLGNYHVFCPGRCAWYQEDAAALLSPEIYREFLVEPERLICESYDQTAIHLHPTSFFLIDDLLANTWLKAIQINKDAGGPGIEETIPLFRRILAAKSLIIRGLIDMDDLKCLRAHLPPNGIFIHIVAPGFDEAAEMLDFIRRW